MVSTRNVIRLRASYGSDTTIYREERLSEALSRRDVEQVIGRARDVLTAMEEEWENDHSSAMLREHFHLLHHYIGFLRQYHEGNL